MKKQNKKSQKEVPLSPDLRQAGDDEKFPGYQKYPANEDIMTRGERIDLDLESTVIQTHPAGKPGDEAAIERIVEDREKPSPSDLTKEDLQALPSDELETDGGDDEILADRVWPVDFAGNDLDVPGAEDDDAQEAVGSEDEENNSYSLGGDRHSDLEEDRS